jgi:hypothetical protein
LKHLQRQGVAEELGSLEVHGARGDGILTRLTRLARLARRFRLVSDAHAVDDFRVEGSGRLRE